jgi:glutathione S-transferase
VNAWWNRCISRPAIKKLFTADEEAMAAVSAAAR